MFEYLRHGLLLVLVLVAAGSDVRYQKIPNYLTLPVIPLAFALHLVEGSGKFWGIVLVTVVTLGVGIVLWGAGVIGGGDAKLVGAIAALEGFSFLAGTLFWSVVLGGVFSVVLLGKRGQLVLFFKGVGRIGLDLLALRMPSFEKFQLSGGQAIPMGAILASGCLVEIYLTLG